ncbi:MAG TPA: trypsin-like peptidase domain-containing protein [Thermoguttaceae bacterium]|nr:trypsin-like peptidase domain-containing protein [Thermoguttaceae bacterium]
MKKKTLILCTVSAFFGALLAIFLYDPPQTEPQSNAQDLRTWKPPEVDLESPIPLGTSGATSDLPPEYADLTPEERVNVAVYESVNRSVVNINTRSVQTDFFFMRESTSEGEGSGTVIDRVGHVLTNFHVVDGARDIQVTLFNGKTFEAQLVGGDAATDMAVLKIDAPTDCLFPAAFGTSTGLRVGQRVLAIGNPFGLERTLSTGIISSLNRTLPRRHRRGTIKSIIQIDCAINPGNSGGPLLDSHGRLIGMNTAIASPTGASAGVGFAIPVNTILRIVPQLIENGRILRADMGITQVLQTEQGLLIAALTPGGAAQQAGLNGPKLVIQEKRQGRVVYQYRTLDRAAADLIVAVDDEPIRSVDDLMNLVESRKPGDEVVVTVIRDGKQTQVPVTLDEEQ